MSQLPFDTPQALRINQARRSFLDAFVPAVKERLALASALDAGCGVGNFSAALESYGLDVTAFDARPELVAEAVRRWPNVRFLVGDVENPSLAWLGVFDLVLCYGLLYHLENPFRALRTLIAATGKLLVLETAVAPSGEFATFLREEEPARDQGLRFLAMVPTEPWCVKCLYLMGMRFVYRVSPLPAHEEFRPSLLLTRRRTILVGSREVLSSYPQLTLVQEPGMVGRYMWYRSVVRNVLDLPRVRDVLARVRRTRSPHGE